MKIVLPMPNEKAAFFAALQGFFNVHNIEPFEVVLSTKEYEALRDEMGDKDMNPAKLFRAFRLYGIQAEVE